MAFNYKRLVDAVTIPNSAGVIFTNTVGKTSYVKLITLHNSNSTPETVKIYRVPDNVGSVGAAGDNTNKVYEHALDAAELITIELAGPGWILEDTNDTIQATTTTASKVIVTIDGAQE